MFSHHDKGLEMISNEAIEPRSRERW